MLDKGHGQLMLMILFVDKGHGQLMLMMLTGGWVLDRGHGQLVLMMLGAAGYWTKAMAG